MNHLVDIPGTPKRSDAKPGMAHFAGSGPPGKTCKQCQHFGDVYDQHNDKYIDRCQKYQQLMGGKVGARISDEYAACRHFEKIPAKKK